MVRLFGKHKTKFSHYINAFRTVWNINRITTSRWFLTSHRQLPSRRSSIICSRTLHKTNPSNPNDGYATSMQMMVTLSMRESSSWHTSILPIAAEQLETTHLFAF
jgi:hypothetical protein